MASQTLLYEGKAKRVYLVENNDQEVRVEFKDDATAFDGKKKGKIIQKGIINNSISSHLFEYLHSHNIKSHFISKLSEREMRVKKVEIIPVEVVMRNIAAGSLCKRYGMEEGKVLDIPILEFYYKNDAFHDPLLNESHIYAMNLATKEDVSKISRMAKKINAILVDYFERRNLKLVDFKLEFGRYKGQVLLADEISPDTCRFWDAESGEKLDKDRFRFDLGNVEEAYKEVYSRLLGEQFQ